MQDLAIYKGLCPNCGGDICSDRLFHGSVCSACIDQKLKGYELCAHLKSGDFLRVCNLWQEVEKFNDIFKEFVGSKPYSIQQTWASRYLNRRSFALLAPTGIGKTTFGLALAIYTVSRSGKAYLIFPTEILVSQAYDRLKGFVKEEEIAIYSSSLPKKKELKEKIALGDFSLLITTTMFLYRNSEIIPKSFFDLIFIDDVDSFLKSAKNLDKIFYLMGLEEEDINAAIRYLSKKEDYAKISEIQRKIKGSLIVSSATSRPKSKRVFLLREILGFEAGKPLVMLRNIEECFAFPKKEVFEDSVELIKEFGDGGLIFLSSVYSKRIEEYINLLRKAGITAGTYQQKDLDAFKKAQIQVLVGISSYNNPLARGIDIPERVRYAIFVGVPRIELPLRYKDSLPSLINLLRIILPYLSRTSAISKEETRKLLNQLRKIENYRYLSYEDLPSGVKETAFKLRDFLDSLFQNKDFLNKIREAEDIPLKVNEQQEIIAIIPDITGYVQASGRTSRLFMDRVTKGLSYVLVDDRKALKALVKKLRYFNEEVQLRDAKEVDIKKVLKEIDEDRKKEFKKKDGLKDKLKSTLIVVESPNKARTIAQFFGKPSRRRISRLDTYEIPVQDRHLIITASKGHIFDLNKSEGLYGVITKNGNFLPVFEVIDEHRKDIISSLREIAVEVNEIFIATDPDTEGEKIAYDIFLALKPYQEQIRRAEFHEVTKRAFIEAINNPRDIDLNLVKAQLLRRIADRWIGFEVSKYLQETLKKSWLSAGRVQSPVLSWVIEREAEARKKIPTVRLDLDSFQVNFQFEDAKQARQFQESVKKVKVEILEKKTEEFYVQPFSTHSLLREAASVFRFSPQQTMQLAQDLFEAGLITYHRTDSIRVSQVGLNIASVYIKEHFGEDLIRLRPFSESEGAHECIRPTRPVSSDELLEQAFFELKDITNQHLRLYDLIFRHFIASQMKPAKLEKAKIRISAEDRHTELELTIQIIEDGSNLLVPVRTYPIKEGDIAVKDKKLFYKPSSTLFNFASLVQEMKNKGIGRPSTYAITIQKLLDRGYVIERKNFLIPTKLGKSVQELIKENKKLAPFVSESFTRELEKYMDDVEVNGENYLHYLRDLYETVFHSSL